LLPAILDAACAAAAAVLLLRVLLLLHGDIVLAVEHLACYLFNTVPA
jgi:hypothetical protein